MRFFAFLPALAGVALALDHLPFPEGAISWTGPVDDSGHNVTFHGKFHEIAGHLRGLRGNKTKAARDVHDIEETMLEKRGRYNHMCNQPVYGYANVVAIHDGVLYIQNKLGNGNCGVAPYSCGRFYCSRNSAILMCNSGNSWSVVPCTTLAQNANFILNTCRHSPGALNVDQWTAGELVQGQAFYENPNYNVLIKKTDKGKEC